MRETKFKAWDKIDKKMRTVTRMTFGLPQVEHPLIIVHLDDGTENPVTRSIEDVVLLQYIGLKDEGDGRTEESRQEIYKGYIVHLWSEYDKKKRIYDEGNWEVYWRNDRWHLRRGKECYDNGDYYQGDECPWPDADNWYPEAEGTKMKVIGNIFENPEW